MNCDFMCRIGHFAYEVTQNEEETEYNKFCGEFILTVMKYDWDKSVKICLSKMTTPGAADLLRELEKEERKYSKGE